MMKNKSVLNKTFLTSFFFNSPKITNPPKVAAISGTLEVMKAVTFRIRFLLYFLK